MAIYYHILLIICPPHAHNMAVYCENMDILQQYMISLWLQSA